MPADQLSHYEQEFCHQRFRQYSNNNMGVDSKKLPGLPRSYALSQFMAHQAGVVPATFRTELLYRNNCYGRDLEVVNHRQNMANDERPKWKPNIIDADDRLNEHILLSSTKRSDREIDTLHKALKPALIMAQCFSLLPVSGITCSDAENLRFHWWSLRVAYSATVFVGSLFVVILSLNRTVNTGVTFLSTAEVMFFVSAAVVTLLFLQLASKWPALMKEWQAIDRMMNPIYGFLPNLTRNMRAMLVVVMFFAIVEHLIANMTSLETVRPCCQGSWKSILRGFYMSDFYQVFSITEYALWKGVLLSLLRLVVTCAWNFTDFFIMFMSVALASKFEQLNHRLEMVKGKAVPSSLWRGIRESYNRLSCLTKLLDNCLSPIVLVSFANHLYFMCQQLLKSLKPLQNQWQATYFVLSFSHLVLRTCAVSLYAATIYDASKNPISILFSVPAESYGVEVQRFLMQVSSDDLALTGCKFFSVTRTLMLTVAGTIVTYGIVLVQFNAVSSDDEVGKNHTINQCLVFFSDV